MRTLSKTLTATTFSLFAACLIYLAAVACLDASTIESAPPRKETGDTSRREDTPPVFRGLEVAPIPQATELLAASLEAPHDIELRRSLARVYHEAGFEAAAVFYGETTQTLTGSQVELEPVVPTVSWVTGERESAGVFADLTRTVSRLASEYRLDEALEVATTSLEKEASLGMAAEWSYVVLLKATLEPDNVSSEALEISLRLLLTGLEEPSMPRPGALVDRASGYETLTRTYTALSDPISALTSAHVGLKALAADEDPARPGYKEAAERLESQILKLQSRLDTDPS